MAMRTHKLAAATAVAAAFSLLATPAAAIDLPRPAAAQAIDGDALNAERGGRHRRHYDDDDIDTEDVVAGVVILGVLAAIAGAAGNRQNRERYEERYPVPDEPDEDAAYIPGRYEHGIDRAVDMCVGEIERTSERVGTVDSASRAGDGWHVAGELANGGPYSCTIGNDGQIGDVIIGDPGVAAAPVEDGQWDDDYADARGVDGDPGDDGRYEIAKAPNFEQ